MTTLAVGVPSEAKVAFVMHLTRPMLNIGGRQVSINPYGGSEGALGTVTLAMVRSVELFSSPSSSGRRSS